MSTQDKINDVLPQLQCKQCGFGGCKPYAAALAAKQTSIDRCLPGGVSTLRHIAGIVGEDASIYEADLSQRAQPQMTAVIQHDACIGCRKCIDACPQDAIVGAMNRNHAILSSACHGCGLCVPACPMDCVSLVKVNMPVSQAVMAPLHRQRHEQLQKRIASSNAQKAKVHAQAKQQGANTKVTKRNRLLYIQEARQRLQGRSDEQAATD